MIRNASENAVQFSHIGLSGAVQNPTTEQQFRQLQKLEAVGRLAGGVAHDFNNLLTVILGCCQMLEDEYHDNPRTSSVVQEIRQAGERAAMLTRQLLLFSRKQKTEVAVVNVNTIVTGLVTMLKRLIGDNIALETDLDPNLGSVKADAGQIEQVVMNLVINARDAMPKGGKLRIETRNHMQRGQDTQSPDGIASGNWVTLVVRDSGCGMSDEVVARLFEPFFTTKEPGKGTGLGLSTVYGIVSQSGGHIRVASKPGLGSRFRIYLPRVQDESVSVKTPCPSKTLGRLRTETILLVEDEPSLSKLAAHTLSSAGYSVMVANHGQEALAMVANSTQPIHLVVTDVIMPFVTGPQLAAKLLGRFPDLKVLYMSGYTDSLLAPHDEQDITRAFLQKPFTPAGLLEAVQSVLTH